MKSIMRYFRDDIELSKEQWFEQLNADSYFEQESCQWSVEQRITDDFTYDNKRMYFKSFNTKAHAVYLRYLLEKEFLKDFRNTSNDEEYFSYINNLSNIEKYQIETYFKKRLNTLKSGV